MAITFLCPNGHKLSCPESQAGKMSKCPRCQERFKVPAPEEAAPAEPSDSSAQIADGADEVSESPSGIKPGQIEFFCPNGHKLHGPESLAGRAGQCPYCKTKFIIPDPNAPEEEETELATDEPADEQPFLPPMEDVEEFEEEGPSFDFDGAGGTEIAPVHPLADLVAQLWRHVADGATVELHLTDGKMLTPERFAAGMSQGSHGVFAVRGGDNKHTLMIVGWESIARVMIRGVGNLDDAAFSA